MEPLDDFIDEARRVARGAFAGAHAHSFLVVRVPAEEEGDWSVFRTTHIAPSSAPLPSAALAYRVFRVVKTGRNPWAGRISIGRAFNNDIVIRDQSVSKLHAHLLVEASSGAASLADAGSSNGTMVNGRRLGEADRVALTPGDELQLGNVQMVFQDAGGFFDFLQSLS